MKHCQYCFLINEQHCVNTCVLSLEPSRYVFSQIGEFWYLTHPEVYDPIATINQLEKETIILFKRLLGQLRNKKVVSK
ncbi:hypothetical protein Sps_03997 [Shewanella psychrophila]|uniref:Uncharacterized protein n=1 Tax=Shewanella psychrophila TaxID=225848 RepID=A0A1S6HUF7_9GAMM|nr:hypothetical protein [Shewanella psychrophila]AQS39112.1 hypothetical protein Sps_03997 [Shewanella psychrophila]